MDLTEHLAAQDGVVARRQALDAGLTQTALNRMVRRRQLVRVHPGVYLNHTGPPTWRQRAWAAVLATGPQSALCLETALRAHEGPGRTTTDDSVLHVAVAHGRNRIQSEGVRLHQMTDLATRVQWNKTPPCTRYDDTVLDLASRGGVLTSVAKLADACGSRRATAARLRDRLGERPRIAQRAWLRSVLSDVADGTCSVLEHGYLDLVERPHGLPTGHRQPVRVGGNGHIYRDVDLSDLGVVVELDGKLFHTSTMDRDRDLDRDLDAAVTGTDLTIRLGFGQVYERPCSTAAKLAVVMQHHGWSGRLTRCDSCRIAA